eukprot:1592978-Pyramimonas_sp.AAC.1
MKLASGRLVGLRNGQIDVPDRYEGVDVLVLVERHCAVGAAVLMLSATGEIVAVALCLAEDAFDVADKS